MANLTITYKIHNVPPGKCTAVFTAQGPTGDVAPITTTVNVPQDKSVVVSVYLPTT